MSQITVSQPKFDYRQTTEAILGVLRGERDRQIVARRFGLGLPKRHTLEKIGNAFGITRERVRQIEKAATARLKSSQAAEINQINEVLKQRLSAHGNVSPLDDLAASIGADTPAERAYIVFLATLAPDIEVIEDSDHFYPALAVLPDYDRAHLSRVTEHLTGHLASLGEPAPLEAIQQQLPLRLPKQTLQNIARTSKKLAQLDRFWGLSHWPTVNPKSIRDKTYLVLNKHGQPLHFTKIADRIASLGQRKRNVTVQAVHNELIKDPRFVLVGRGIYALAEWGYTPGTVADIITDVLRQESPLHKDEIVKRVLQKRQVKTTTIVLNLQEKNQFVRVSKATYALR